mmetsp:Transcript_6874/g.16667  ORF Transcript_6874/g.16667 Transcript_6874/m.16667 type:complete len:131 (-) Transcript_6874:106-498(-)
MDFVHRCPSPQLFKEAARGRKKQRVCNGLTGLLIARRCGEKTNKHQHALPRMALHCPRPALPCPSIHRYPSIPRYLLENGKVRAAVDWLTDWLADGRGNALTDCGAYSIPLKRDRPTNDDSHPSFHALAV